MKLLIVFLLPAVAVAGPLKGSAPAGPVDWPAKQRPAPAGSPCVFVPFGKAIPRSRKEIKFSEGIKQQE